MRKILEAVEAIERELRTINASRERSRIVTSLTVIRAEAEQLETELATVKAALQQAGRNGLALLGEKQGLEAENAALRAKKGRAGPVCWDCGEQNCGGHY